MTDNGRKKWGRTVFAQAFYQRGQILEPLLALRLFAAISRKLTTSTLRVQTARLFRANRFRLDNISQAHSALSSLAAKVAPGLEPWPNRIRQSAVEEKSSLYDAVPHWASGRPVRGHARRHRSFWAALNS